eukprot:scaffold22406_cov58-Phaeocystis_antarctica.AAC.2
MGHHAAPGPRSLDAGALAPDPGRHGRAEKRRDRRSWSTGHVALDGRVAPHGVERKICNGTARAHSVSHARVAGRRSGARLHLASMDGGDLGRIAWRVGEGRSRNRIRVGIWQSLHRRGHPFLVAPRAGGDSAPPL